MSLISQDFRLNKQQPKARGPIRLRWALLAIAGAGIGAVIASTNTETKNDELAADTLPTFKAVTKSSEQLARESFSLSLPELQAQQEILDDANNLSPKQWREYKVKSGDNLARLFKRASIKPQQLDELMKSGDEAKKLTKIFPKDIIRILTDDEGTLQALRYDIDHKSYLMVERENGTLVAKTFNHEIETRNAHASGVIESSLYLAAQEAGISQNIIMELANVFGWDIDFALDIRKGDSFTVLYEELYRNGEKISDGDILAAEFINDGNAYRAVRYTNPQTNVSEYYTPDGKSMRKAFLRTPVNFSRISSRFTVSRYHPVLHKVRSHKGVDYAAKSGTPIYAAGDGKVIFKGKKGGYGKVMIVQHGSKYTTLYAHLKTYNRKLRVGSKVKQGQTIAYVGQTGLATGPHLHYEFRVNGVHRNPLTVKLPASKPVPKRYMADFELSTTPKFAQLDLLARTQQVALAETEVGN
ncbi:MAG: peptidoglycan DD-metalloendopeptidase family protein [Gammaproteobacteria bacterium]|nr:peptidoglycan DD-metalloendopeptidase family protein [Gammaproteobacteria bacterium]MBT8134224.1 peptidoglycan DD-metalloendopeptidase family protein [Gammaproteobacteria bacterium]NNJ51326.1 peptidoglycan DD-metalloendopeptidase family protein [Gammaproteobacteria bacterium]